MEHLTILLSRVVGIHLLLEGVLVIVNSRNLLLGFHSWGMGKAYGLAKILVGLFFVVFYENWFSLPGIIISLLAWITLLKGLAYTFIPETVLAKHTSGVAKRSWRLFAGTIAMIIGLYLAGFGFGFW